MNPRHALLSGSVQYLKGVGPRRAEKLAKLNVRSGRDLLYHLPHRYEDATTVTPAARLKPGDEASVIGRVVSKGVLPTRRGLRIFHAVLRDDSGMIECAWPGQPWLDRTIRRGDLLLVAGPVRFYHGRQLQPREYTVLASRDEVAEDADRGRIFPIYPATEGLSHRQIRGVMAENLPRLLGEVVDLELFSPEWRREIDVPELSEALATLHEPASLSAVEPARRRLAYEELFFIQLLHARARRQVRREGDGVACDGPETLVKPFLDALPFSFTAAQTRAWAEIRSDMEEPSRMYRLLQGDVGSGKTVVAAAAMLKAVENDRQAAIMAPTELLAEQHFRSLSRLTSGLSVEPRLLTGSVAGKARDRMVGAIADGEARFVIGTHALIQKGIDFAALGLVVIDEQHRFGVEQRRLLRDAGETADTLVMSATPIPRSLALTLYGDLELSVIDELPPGRVPVRTAVRGPGSREKVLDFVRQKLEEGRQAYVVYPLVEESELVDAKAATDGYEELTARFDRWRVGLLHGRLSAAEKDDVMRSFLSGEIDVLVATTVIEVGIDVPNATVMVIEHAERFGLAQLHQLRGRVGRGAEQSYCIAFHPAGETPQRLQAFQATTDGFEIARADLRIRGQGNMFGMEQHGLAALRFANLELDADLLEHARGTATRLIAADPELQQKENRAIGRVLMERYAEREQLYEVG
jgi:ATP-dependent DNA helicase RecG